MNVPKQLQLVQNNYIYFYDVHKWLDDVKYDVKYEVVVRI